MKIAVTAFPRTLQGTGASRRLRATGRVPGVIYGADKPAQAVELDHAALLRHLKLEAFHASILDMTLDGSTFQVLLRDFQMHPFKAQALHADFQRVDKNKKIHMRVPLHFLNAETCVGVKQGGGVVQHIMNDVEVQCLPDDLPEYIEIDLIDLQVGHSIHVAEVKMPKGVEPIPRVKQDNPAIVAVQIPREAAAEETAAGAPVTEITGQKPEEAAADGDKKDGAKEAPKKDDKK